MPKTSSRKLKLIQGGKTDDAEPSFSALTKDSIDGNVINIKQDWRTRELRRMMHYAERLGIEDNVHISWETIADLPEQEPTDIRYEKCFRILQQAQELEDENLIRLTLKKIRQLKKSAS